jgi:hypothetical protein
MWKSLLTLVMRKSLRSSRVSDADKERVDGV